MLSVLTDNWDLFRDGFWTDDQAVRGLRPCSAWCSAPCWPRSGSPRFRRCAAVGTGYVNTLRNTPLTLVFAFLVFGAPKMELGSALLRTGRAVVALTIYTSAFVCEVVRSGINTVSPGQSEAARAVGMTFVQVLRLIVLPQAFRAIVPPLTSVFIALLKNTTIAAGFSRRRGRARSPAAMSERGENQMLTLIWIAIGFLILIAPAGASCSGGPSDGRRWPA